MHDQPDIRPPAPLHGGGMATLQRLFAGADHPDGLLSAFADGMSTLPGELGDMGGRLQSAFRDSDWDRYGRLLRQLIDKYIRTVELDDVYSTAAESERFRELLRMTLDVGVASLVEDSPDLLEENGQVRSLLDQWQPGGALDALSKRVRELCHQIGVRSHSLDEQRELLVSLFDLLLENVAELLDNSNWMQGQISTVRDMLARPLDRQSVERTRNELREVMYRQGLLKQGIEESKQSMRELMVGFVDQVEGMAASTGDYHDRISGYQVAIRQASNLNELGQLMQDVLGDTGRIQQQALRARDSLASARAEVAAAEARIQQLEQELEEATGLVRTDPLTGALNRRGLEELMQREMARAQRANSTLSVILIDLNNFHHTNTRHGHAGGDKALRHLVAVLQAQLRSCDAIGRLGGDEFVLVLPDTGVNEATATAARLEATMAQRPLLHDNERIHVSFSAGPAQWMAGEPLDTLLERADRLLFAAKRTRRTPLRPD